MKERWGNKGTDSEFAVRSVALFAVNLSEFGVCPLISPLSDGFQIFLKLVDFQTVA